MIEALQNRFEQELAEAAKQGTNPCASDFAGDAGSSHALLHTESFSLREKHAARQAAPEMLPT